MVGRAGVVYQNSGGDTPSKKIVTQPQKELLVNNVRDTTEKKLIQPKENESNDSVLPKGTGGPVEVVEQKNDSIRRAVEEINKNVNNSEAIFGIHESTNRVMIKIVDKETKDVIKEFPPEETLDMIAKLWEFAGIMIDEKG
jgi:flagellar protein FlaG